MISRQDALNFLNEKIENKQASSLLNKNIIKHMLATEALMGGVYDFLAASGKDLGGNKEEWTMAGLLHDGDYVEGVPEEKQGVQITEWLREKGFEIPDNVAHAMAAHNLATGVSAQNLMDWAIFCGDSLTGLIIAACLVLPTKKLADLTVESVLKRFKEPKFAAATRREDIALCQEKLGIPLERFVEIALTSMQRISNELEL